MLYMVLLGPGICDQVKVVHVWYYAYLKDFQYINIILYQQMLTLWYLYLSVCESFIEGVQCCQSKAL